MGANMREFARKVLGKARTVCTTQILRIKPLSRQVAMGRNNLAEI